MHGVRASMGPVLLVAGVACLGSMLLPVRAGEVETAGRLPPPVRELPAGRTDVFSFLEGDGVDRQATLALLPGGGFLLVHSRYERGDMDSSTLWTVISPDGSTVSGPGTLAFGGEVEDAPSFVNVQGSPWLYFASGDADLGSIALWRSRLASDGSLSAPERLEDVAGLGRLTHWPRWVDAGREVFLTFRGERSRPYWLRLEDGVEPGAPVPLAGFGVAYPRVVPMAGRGCFFSYQRPPEGGYMATYFSLSADCSEWSEPVALSWPGSPGKPDVHDAFALPRLDGGVDVYYVYPSLKGPGARFQVGFDLYRRAVMTDGRLGVEELLTERDDFHPFAPSAHRLGDGSILVGFSDIHASADTGVTSARLSLFKLAFDAAAPD